MSNEARIEELKLKRELINSVSCSFCTAKWLQTTLYLQNGYNHSCHHPSPHKIPLEEIENNPSALHNTKQKKLYRKQMLESKRPDECDYCWNIEESSNAFSVRTYKSSEPWSAPHFEDIVKAGYEHNFNPKYVEVSFSNTCNFKCSYCGPQYSSKWVEEINQFGPYKTSTRFNDIELFKKEGTMPYLASDHNPYVEAFWKWWPEMYQDLHTFRITGGEPLLSKDTFKLLDYIIETPTPNKKLSLCINSNLGIPKKLFDEFVLKIEKILRPFIPYRQF